MNWFVAVKETQKKTLLSILYGYLGTADHLILIVRSGSLEQRGTDPYNPIGRGRWRRRSGWRSFTFVFLHWRATRPTPVENYRMLLVYLPVTWSLACEPYLTRRGTVTSFISLPVRKECICVTYAPLNHSALKSVMNSPIQPWRDPFSTDLGRSHLAYNG